jgi:hypothetical protein
MPEHTDHLIFARNLVSRAYAAHRVPRTSHSALQRGAREDLNFFHLGRNGK